MITFCSCLCHNLQANRVFGISRGMISKVVRSSSRRLTANGQQQTTFCFSSVVSSTEKANPTEEVLYTRFCSVHRRMGTFCFCSNPCLFRLLDSNAFSCRHTLRIMLLLGAVGYTEKASIGFWRVLCKALAAERDLIFPLLVGAWGPDGFALG